MHCSHQRGTRPGPHVNHSSRGRLFSREIIIVRDIRRRSSLIIFFLPCRAIKWSHSVTENRYRNKLYETICKYQLLVWVCVSDSYLSWGVTSFGGFFRYCLKRSSKAWPMVLMTSWAKPSEHSRIWHAAIRRHKKLIRRFLLKEACAPTYKGTIQKHVCMYIFIMCDAVGHM